MPAAPKTQYLAYCLRCAGGGKVLGTYAKKRDAERECTGHMNAYGCHTTVMEVGK